MTSRTGQKRSRLVRSPAVRRSSCDGRRPYGRTTSQNALRGGLRTGFTLVEVVLAVSLVLVLLCVAAVSYSSWSRTCQMEEGVFRFQALLRMARSESANLGNKFRLEFDEATGSFKVTYEAQPLTEPSVFQDYTGSQWATDLPTDVVKVSLCRLTGTSAYAPAASEFILKSTQTKTLPPITFYPDGSCDSAVLELAGVSDEETRTAVVELDGTNRLIHARILLPSELEEYHEQLADGGG